MIAAVVIDASVAVDYLARYNPSPIASLLVDDRQILVAPALIDVEVLNAMRGLERSGAVPASRRQSWLRDFEDLPIERFGHEPLRPRIWSLRGHFTAYDATYIALAELLDVALITRDRKLARAGGHAADVVVV